MTSSPRPRLLVIHAGTHKTASSYIQSRMAANTLGLLKAGVRVHHPVQGLSTFKALASSLARGQWEDWHAYLHSLPPQATTVVMSAEQFTQPLARSDRHGPLLKLLAKYGFRLRVVVFLRDQPDYINARFVHSTRRLYHHQSFEDYLAEQLSPSRRAIYDYEHLFRPLLDRAKRRTHLDCVFLPYATGLGDPFERLMESQGWQPPEEGWRAADPSRSNVQPGRRGVWLAQAISAKLADFGVEASALVNTGGVVRRIAEQQGWTEDRYCGFDTESARRVSDHFRASNDAFAQRVWGCSWRQMVPEVPMRRSQFTLTDHPGERRRMQRLVWWGIASLAWQNPLGILGQRTRHTLTLAASRPA